jgi:hypothetical protein
LVPTHQKHSDYNVFNVFNVLYVFSVTRVFDVFYFNLPFYIFCFQKRDAKGRF